MTEQEHQNPSSAEHCPLSGCSVYEHLLQEKNTLRWRAQNFEKENERLTALNAEMLEKLVELEAAIERRWQGETQRKRENAVSPRTEEALNAARAIIAKATES